MDLQSIGISNAFTAPCFYSFQHAHAGGLQIHPNVRECLLMTYRVDIIRRTHVNLHINAFAPSGRNLNTTIFPMALPWAVRSLGFQPASSRHSRAPPSRQAVRLSGFQPSESSGGCHSEFLMNLILVYCWYSGYYVCCKVTWIRRIVSTL